MNTETFDTVYSTACNVRSWAEAQARGDMMSSSLEGMCARASAELFRQLVTAGLWPELHAWQDGEGCAHVFVVVEDHVVDITATQFSRMRDKKVFIMHHRLASAEFDWYSPSEIFRNVAELIRWQKKTNWADHKEIAR